MNRDFKLLLGGQLVSQVGDKFHMIALALWVLETTGSSAKMGTVLAASMIPGLILGLFSGVVIDRYPRKIIIVGTDIIRGLVLLIFAWMMASGQMNFYLILILQVILSINAAFFDPAIPSIIPQIVKKKQLSKANALHQSVYSFAMIGGAILGGVAVGALGYVWVFALDGISFLISAGFESLIRIPKISKEKFKGSFKRDLIDGYSYLFSSRSLLIVLFLVMLIHFFVGGIEVFMPIIAQHTENGPQALGAFQAALGAGILVMSLILSRFTISGKEKNTLFSSVIAMGGVQILTWFISPANKMATAGYAVCFFLWGAAMIRAAVSFKTILQTYVDNTYGGRIFAVASTIGNASIPAAMIIFGLLLDYTDYSNLLPISGFALTVLGLIAFVLFKEERHDTEKCSARSTEGASGSNRGET
ncbi:MFS transporter [Marinifilum sp. JC120]|nr:MFS transporter [Marinifilum sp. JC120]